MKVAWLEYTCLCAGFQQEFISLTIFYYLGLQIGNSLPLQQITNTCLYILLTFKFILHGYTFETYTFKLTILRRRDGI